jgi:hypothetical protein
LELTGFNNMPLPTDFSPWEHLQNTIRNAHNQQVRKEFADIEIDDDINTARGSLKLASLIDDKDTAAMVVSRLILYHIIIKDNDFPYYSVPITYLNESIRFFPQIHLIFAQNFRDAEENESPVISELKIRWRSQTETTITTAELNTLAQKIKTLFGSGTGFTWQRGKAMFTYADKEKFYNVQLLVSNATEGKRIVEQLLDIQGDTPDWSKSSYKVNEEPLEAFPTVPPRKTILGKSRKQPRKRPICSIRFRSALLHIHSFPNPIALYDKTGYYRKAILKD